MFPAGEVALANVIQLQAHPHSLPFALRQLCLQGMDLFEQFLEAFAVLAVVIQNYLDLLVARGVGLEGRL